MERERPKNLGELLMGFVEGTFAMIFYAGVAALLFGLVLFVLGIVAIASGPTALIMWILSIASVVIGLVLTIIGTVIVGLRIFA